MDQDRNSWQMKSQARGFKVLGFSIPMFLIGFIASSQIPRLPPDKIFEGRSQNYKISGQFLVKGKGEAPLQVFASAANYSGPAVKVFYKVKEKKDTIRSRRVKSRLKMKDGLQQPIDRIFKVPSGVQYKFYGSLGKKKFKKLGIKSWKISIVRNPSQPHIQILRGLEIMIWPALSFILLGLVMIFVPKFINSN